MEKNLAAERVHLVPLESIRSLAARHAASKEDDDAAACSRDGELVGPADLLRLVRETPPAERERASAGFVGFVSHDALQPP